MFVCARTADERERAGVAKRVNGKEENAVRRRVATELKSATSNLLIIYQICVCVRVNIPLLMLLVPSPPPPSPLPSPLFVYKRRCCVFSGRIYEPCFIGVGYILALLLPLPLSPPMLPILLFSQLCDDDKDFVLKMNPFKMKMFTILGSVRWCIAHKPSTRMRMNEFAFCLVYVL